MTSSIQELAQMEIIDRTIMINLANVKAGQLIYNDQGYSALVLWHGNFLDGRLTITMPMDQAGTAEDEVQISALLVPLAKDLNSVSEEEVLGGVFYFPKDTTPTQQIEVILDSITAVHTEKMTAQLLERAANGKLPS